MSDMDMLFFHVVKLNSSLLVLMGKLREVFLKVIH